MTDEQLAELDVPSACFEQARVTIKALEEYNDAQSEPNAKYNIEETIAFLADDPLHFVLEGGSDGTFGHAEYRSMFGPIHKQIIDLAAMIAGVKGIQY